MIAQDRFIKIGAGAQLDNADTGHIGRNLNWDKLLGTFKITNTTQLAYCSAGPAVAFAALKEPQTPDYIVGATFSPKGTPTGKSPRICIRMDPAHQAPQDQTFYGLEYDVASASYRLIRRDNGVDAAPLASAVQALTTPTPGFIRCRGNVIEGWVNNALLLTATDNTITGKGSFGLYSAAAQDPANAIVLDGSQTAVAPNLGFWATNAWEADAPWADRFDDPEPTPLENHRSDSGATYAQHPLHLGKSAQIRNTLINSAKCSTFGGLVRIIDAGAHYLSSDTIPNDFDADLVFDALQTPLTSVYFTFRASRTSDDYYYCGWNHTGQFEIGKVVAGVRSVIPSGTYAATPAANDRSLGELSVRGNNFVFKWKGTERINVTDNQFASGAAGVWSDQATTDVLKGLRLQNVYVRAPQSPPADVVHFTGDALSDWGSYPPRDQNKDDDFWGHVLPAGSRQTMTGVGGRYTSISDDGGRIRYEPRTGDWVYAREKAMNKQRTTVIKGMEDWDTYIGFRLYVPGNQEISTGSVFGIQSSQEIWATHQNQLVPPSSDPGIETTSLKIANSIVWRMNGRGGWEDTIGSQIYASVYDGQILGNIVFDALNDFVFHILNSPDPGVGRVEAWFSGGGAWVPTDKRFGPYPAATMDYARANYHEIGWYRTPRGTRLPNIIELDGYAVGNTFASVDPKL